MAHSYQKINYSLRIAKSIERKMLADVFRKLSVFKQLNKYRYIGFGSTFFTDFILYHKQLAIDNMISIEKQELDKERFLFNKPYSCINMIFDDSNNVLPSIDWSIESILWLDYDNHLNKASLNDINTFFANAVSGSLFLITVNANADTYVIDINDSDNESSTNSEFAEVRSFSAMSEFRKNKVIERIGHDKLPRELTNNAYTSKKFPDIYYQVILNEINNILTNRNLILSDEDKLTFEQILNIEYQDGAKMLTIGGLLFKEKDRHKFIKANFNELVFFSNNMNRFKIEIPSLTFKEIRYLDTYLPSQIKSDGSLKYNRKNAANLPVADILKYKALYKYYPTFAEAIV